MNAARLVLLAPLLALAPAAGAAPAGAACLACHERLQPGLVADWRLSRHAEFEVGCDACHGARHGRADDAALAALPTIDTCQRCHALQAAQFRNGKHARAWAAVRALPTFHHLRQGQPDDLSGCASCHRIGLKTEAEQASLRRAGQTHGLASCDACHTRHLFSVKESREPEACRSCHGFLQYQAWASSKHGTRYQLRATGRLPEGAAAPTCQRCHFQDGDHANRTPLGNLALRLPLADDRPWAADKHVLFVALGALTRSGDNGPRARAFEEAGLSELDRLDFPAERAKLLRACQPCHASGFVREQLDRRDGMIRRADALTASAVSEIEALYQEGLLPRSGPGPYPDLVRWPVASPVEQRLGQMFFDHRARLMATAFHMSAQAADWMSALEQDLFAVQQLGGELRQAPRPARRPAPAPGR